MCDFGKKVKSSCVWKQKSMVVVKDNLIWVNFISCMSGHVFINYGEQ